MYICSKKLISAIHKSTFSTARSESNEEIFKKNAFLLYRNADRILNDSKMTLAPVPIQSGLTIVGSAGFENPCLGTYIEWWKTCEPDMTKDAQGRDALTIRIAGSPLSGGNRCDVVYPNGTVTTRQYKNFHSIFKAFLRINRQYKEMKGRDEAYSIKEVVERIICKRYNG